MKPQGTAVTCRGERRATRHRDISKEGDLKLQLSAVMPTPRFNLKELSLGQGARSDQQYESRAPVVTQGAAAVAANAAELARYRGTNGLTGVRVSPQIYITTADLDRFVAALHSVVAKA